MNVDLPVIIVNPKSGGGISEQNWASVAARLRNHLGPFDCAFTRGPADAIRLAEEEAQAGRRLIVACGGDGTVSEVANGILRAGGNAELGLLHRGTGGDFCRNLKLPTDFEKAAKRLKEGKMHRMDAGLLTYTTREGQETKRFFINTASFGLSGEVASRANVSEKRWGGTATYMAATLKALVSYKYPDVVLQVDAQPETRLRIVTVCVANGPAFGGGMKIAPGAKLNDGLFNVVVIAQLKPSYIVLNSYKLYTGGVLTLDRVKHSPAKRVTATPVDSSEEILLEVDGESPGKLPASFEILPLALKIRV